MRLSQLTILVSLLPSPAPRIWRARKVFGDRYAMLTRLIPFTERLVQLTIKGFIRSGSWRPLWAHPFRPGHALSPALALRPVQSKRAASKLPL